MPVDFSITSDCAVVLFFKFTPASFKGYYQTCLYSSSPVLCSHSTSAGAQKRCPDVTFQYILYQCLKRFKWYIQICNSQIELLESSAARREKDEENMLWNRLSTSTVTVTTLCIELCHLLGDSASRRELVNYLDWRLQMEVMRVHV